MELHVLIFAGLHVGLMISIVWIMFRPYKKQAHSPCRDDFRYQERELAMKWTPPSRPRMSMRMAYLMEGYEVPRPPHWMNEEEKVV